MGLVQRLPSSVSPVSVSVSVSVSSSEMSGALHSVACKGCNKFGRTFTGLRYKCDVCRDFNLCEECHAKGVESGSHSSSHPMTPHEPFKESGLGHAVTASCCAIS